MKLKLALAALICLSFVAAAHAAGIRYYEDPVYVKINKDDEHPMDDLITLAAEGDARAQFILGDLYSKGKGGLARNRVKARYWFEISARHGFTPAFVRLGALAKHSRDYIGAVQWYKLDADHAKGKEGAWSKSEYQRLAKSLSKNALKEALNGADDWLKHQREAMREILASEEHARQTLPPPDLGDGPNKDADRGGDSDDKKTAVKDDKNDPDIPKKETHYNE
jgi:hypothetical protein